MSVQVIRAGSTVRVQIRPRSIADTYVQAGYLYVVYSDGTIDNAGYVGGGIAPQPEIVYANSDAVYANSDIYLGGLNGTY